ncbi:MAG: IS200/IS605 family transposase [Acidobacteriia bacterium]|nr:IS200/IS605 family transposase [Terriglobia bacterium]
MAHTLVQNYIHVVFSTKDRRKSIPKNHQPRLWRYIVGICKNEGVFIHEIGGMEDHVHLLIQLPPTLSLSDAILSIKASSSKWMGPKFAWQRGFGAFSVSASNLNAVVRYVRNQEAHHRKMTFDQEFIALLKKHGVEFDLKYVFG